MHIKHLIVRNFMKIDLVDLALGDGVVNLAGDNGQGKTSIILAIVAALGGKKALSKALGLPKAPSAKDIIRRGTEMAEVVVDLDKYVVTWRRTLEKETVEIRSVDGGKYGRTDLDKKINFLAFNPLSFNGLKAADQRRVLLELGGVDLADIETRYDAAYQRRHDANLAGRLAVARIGDEVEGAPGKAVDIDALCCALDEAVALCQDNAARSREGAALVETARVAEKAEKEAGELLSKQSKMVLSIPVRHQEELETLKQQHTAQLAEMAESQASDQDAAEGFLQGMKEAHSRKAQASEECLRRSHLFEMPVADPDLDPLREAIDEARSDNALYDQAQARKQRREEAADLTAAAEAVNDEMVVIAGEKARLVDGIEMPVKGLGLSDTGVLWEGNPLELENTSLRIRVCAAIVAKLNPDLRIAMVQEGDKLDDKSFTALSDACRKLGLEQLWIERRVADNDDPGDAIVIEAGLVKP